MSDKIECIVALWQAVVNATEIGIQIGRVIYELFMFGENRYPVFLFKYDILDR